MDITDIIFDWGGVLTVGKHRAGIIRILEEKYRVKIKDKRHLFGSYMDNMDKIDRSEITFEQFVNHMNKQFGINLTPAEMMQVFKEAIIPNKPIIEIAKQLRKKYRVSMLSNNNEPTVSLLREFHREMLAPFEKIVFSCEVNLYKPQLEIYELALSQLNAKPKNCVFIDDMAESLETAEKLEIN